MNEGERVAQIPADSAQSLPKLRDLMLVAVVLPATIVAIDHLTWMRVDWNQYVVGFDARQALFLLWLVLKTAILAWTARAVFSSSAWGWGIFLWSTTLLSVQSYGVSHGSTREYALTLISAEFGVLAVWSILGTTSIAWRLTATLLGASAVVLVAKYIVHGGITSWTWDEQGKLLMAVVQSAAAGALVLVAFILRAAGFRLRNVESLREHYGREPAIQFGVKHMLIWTAAMAPLLLVTKGMDVTVFRRFEALDFYPAVLIGGCIVLVNLATIWLALGMNHAVARWLAVAATAVGSGLLLQYESANWFAAYGPWPNMQLLGLAIRMGIDGEWLTWFVLTAALLAAMLTFLRACGYRLAKAGVDA